MRLVFEDDPEGTGQRLSSWGETAQDADFFAMHGHKEVDDWLMRRFRFELTNEKLLEAAKKLLDSVVVAWESDGRKMLDLAERDPGEGDG